MNITKKAARKRIIVSILIVLCITFIAFLPSLHNSFVNWDDDIYVYSNNLIKSLSWNNVTYLFTSWFNYYLYHPLTLVSLAVDYHFFKLNPQGYHVTNLVLHLLNCVLVFWFILLLAESVKRRAESSVHSLSANLYPLTAAFITALLFGIHPLRVESVAWVAERKDVLYTFFFLGSLISYVYFVAGKWKYYGLSLGLFVLSIISKPTAISLPVILVLIDYFNERKFSKNTVIEKIPFFVVSIIIGIVTIVAQNSGKSNYLSFTVFENILISFNGFLMYLTKTVFPVNLSCVYPYPDKVENMFPLIFYISPFIVMILVGIVLSSIKYTRKIVWGSLFFLFTIGPVLKYLPIGEGMIAERYTYVPLIGLFYLMSEGIVWINQNFKIKNQKLRNILFLVVLGLIIGTLSVLTWQRCKVWENGFTLWSDVIKNYPEYSKAYNNRGNIYLSRNEYDNAITDYNRALELNQNYAKVFNNRGNAYRRKKEYGKAVSDYNRALELDPNCEEAYNNRGNVYLIKEEYDKALADYNKALSLDPNITQIYYNRGIIYLINKDYTKAQADIKKFKESGGEVDPKILILIQQNKDKIR